MNWLAWALLAAAFAGITAVLAKAGLGHVNSHLATALRTSVILVFTWAIAAATVRPADWAALDRRTVIFLAASGVAAGLSWLCYFRALQLGNVSQVAPIDKLSVVFASLLAVAVLHEQLGVRAIAGLVLIVAGSVLVASQ